MLKNKTIFKSIAVALIMIMMVAALSPSVGMVYAIAGSNGATGTTDVNYEVDQTGWTFSVPAAQEFTKEKLTMYGNVSISPEADKDIISLPSGQTITMTFEANNYYNGGFELRNGSNSVIPYSIGLVTKISSEGAALEVSNFTSNGCTVLTYEAGSPSNSNTGLSKTMAFSTTLDNIKNAKVTGLHTDTLTFTVNVTGGTSGSGSESGGGNSQENNGYTASFNFVPDIYNLSISINEGELDYHLSSLDFPESINNVKTITFYYWDTGAAGFDNTVWDIGTSAGSNDIGTVVFEFKKDNRITYTLTENTTFYISERKNISLSTFTIDGKSYQFEEGMTWVEWVNSDYNTYGWYIEDDHITDGEYWIIISDTPVPPDDMIIPEAEYYLR